MKIIYHHRTLGDGAEGIHIREMVTAFREAGHQVTVVGPVGEHTQTHASRSTLLAKIKSFCPHIVYEFLELGYNIYGYYLLRQAIKQNKPDFIYDRYMIFNASAVLIGKRYDIPVFLEVNAPLALERSEQKDERLYLKKIAFVLEKWICNNSFKTIVVSTPLKKYLMAQGVVEDKIFVLPNGVNIKKFRPLPKDVGLLDALDLPQHSLIIGFVGILRPWHGLDLLLAAFKKIYRKHTNVRLLIVGDGPIREDIEKQIEENRLNGKVIITGRVKHDDIARYISLFDIAVSPKATFYASPMKILEYMALGKAVVAPNTENIQDIVEDGKSGVLFESGMVDALEDSLLKLIADRNLQKGLGAKARNCIFSKFTWENNVRLVEKMLEGQGF